MKTWTTVDRSGWPSGPWDNEPDKIQWYDETTGMPCLVVRGPVGALCGYVGVNPDHPWHGIDHSGAICGHNGCDEHRPDGVIEVHGGLTYSDRCNEDAPEGEGICHIPDPGKPGDVWWFGFDCSHLGDRSPELRKHEHEVYRTVDYVQGECTRLAQQLAEVT